MLIATSFLAAAFAGSALASASNDASASRRLVSASAGCFSVRKQD
jgi:hypothetical protein